MLNSIFKVQFFDSPAVIRALGRARARVLNEYGRRIRKRAQSSLRYAAGPSAPGTPPHVHRYGKRIRRSKSTGRVQVQSVSYLRSFLFYKFDPQTKSVVIGPERLSSTAHPETPEILEYGGSEPGGNRVIVLKNPVGRGVQVVKLTGTLRYPARPFMHPAERAERPGLAPLWRDSIRP